MRKIVTTCVFAVFLLSQGTEMGQAASPVAEKSPVTVVHGDRKTQVTDGEVSSSSITGQEICEIPHTEAEDQELVETFVNECFPGAKKIDMTLYANATRLLRVEEQVGVPDSVRGITLASACIESGYNPNAEGDHRFSKDKKTPMAIGILQMWPCFETAYKINRRDIEQSATTWLTHVKKQLSSVRKNCGADNDSDAWRLALVHGIRAPKRGGRCNENTSHWRFFRRVKEKINKRNA